MTDYSIWEVILNGDSPTPTRVVDGVVQPIDPITAEQRLAKKNRLNARGTLLMALPDKHQLKFNIHKDAKSLMEAIEKRFGGNKETKKVQKTLLKQQYENFTSSSSESLDQIHDRLQKLISQLEILGESLSQEDINLKFLRSLPSENKADMEDQSLDDLFNNLMIYKAESNSPQLDNDDLKQIDADELKEMDLKWQMAMMTKRARRFLQKTGRNLGANGTTSIWFDMSKVECYNCHRKGHFTRECRSPKDTRNKDTQRRSVLVETSTSNALVSQCDGLEYVEARLVVYQQNENVFEEDIKLLKLDVMLRDNALVELRKKFKAAEKERDELKHTLEKFQTSLKNLKLRMKFKATEKERDELKHTLEKFQTSLKNLSKLLESQITDKTELGYDNQLFNSTVFDCDELNNYESDVSVPTSLVHDRYKSGAIYHAVPPPYIETIMPPKPDLVFHDAPTVSETVSNVLNVKPSITKPTKDMS
nr:hypothetical protein [Tanacetum cinerariifolium]